MNNVNSFSVTWAQKSMFICQQKSFDFSRAFVKMAVYFYFGIKLCHCEFETTNIEVFPSRRSLRISDSLQPSTAAY